MRQQITKIISAFLIVSFFYGYSDLLPIVMACRGGPAPVNLPAACGMAVCCCSQDEHPDDGSLCEMVATQKGPAQGKAPTRFVCSFRTSNCDPVTNVPVLTLSKNILSLADSIEISCFPNDLEFIPFFAPTYLNDYVAAIFHPPRV
ncbi:MAG: hypothetical protein ACE5IR_27990 [bacterium]